MQRWLAAALLCLVLAALGWFFRWEVVTPTVQATEYTSAGFFMVNRWTGEIRYVSGRGSITLEHEP